VLGAAIEYVDIQVAVLINCTEYKKNKKKITEYRQ